MSAISQIYKQYILQHLRWRGETQPWLCLVYSDPSEVYVSDTIRLSSNPKGTYESTCIESFINGTNDVDFTQALLPAHAGAFSCLELVLHKRDTNQSPTSSR